ncbi:transposase, partial [Roseateles sp. GG27B]
MHAGDAGHGAGRQRFPASHAGLRRQRQRARHAAQMSRDMGAAKGATIVMDAGIASEANLDWLCEQGLHYLVKGRLSARQFDPQRASE